MKKIWIVLILTLFLALLLTPEESSDRDWEYQLKKYARIYALLKEYYPEKLDAEKLVFSSIDGFIKSLDPHSYFLDPLSMRSMNEDQQGNYYGIGTRITKYEDRLTVVAPLEGTPAQKLGIMAGDVIVEIEGESTKEMSLDDAMKKLRGAKGTIVNIKIKRDGVENLLSYRIKRAEIPLDSISYSVVHPQAPKIGYIAIRTFGSTTAEEFKENLGTLVKENNIKALILDLRWNVGGSLYSAIDIADFFLERGKVVVSIKGRKVSQSFTASKNDQYENMPLAVLINRVSASASEIVAAAVQDHKKGTIIGTRSWGKGLVQTVYNLSLNSSLALTTAKYYTPENRCLQRDFSKMDEYFSILSKKDYDTNQSIKGGVIPDILIEGQPTPDIIVEFISRGIFFKFSRKVINGIPEINKDFKADKNIIKRFKHFLKRNKIDYDAEEFRENVSFIKDNIEREVLSNKFSVSEGIKVFLKSDPVTRKAVDVLKERLKKTGSDDNRVGEKFDV